MRYSVLLPTRNGGKYLRNCIESILAQDHDGFELVISDNANDDETPDVVASYANDPRVKAIRLEEPVSVTDNWNAAYRASSGDYILMMGDDDFLLPDYFRKMDALLDAHDAPDCVLYNGYSFVAPGSISGDPRSFWSEHHFEFGPELQREKILSDEQKLGIVRDIFRWKMRIPHNMQTALVARRTAERVEGGFFQPPFPDHYALNAMLLMNCRWLFTPERLVIVGVSPKSFGHYLYSGKQDTGLAYLGIDPRFPGELPGSPLLNGVHVWLNRLLERFPRRLAGIKVDREGYVRRQVRYWLLQKKYGGLGWADLARRFGHLSSGDWLRLGASPFDAESLRRVRSMLSRRIGAVEGQWDRLCPIDGVDDIAGFSRSILERRQS